MAGNLVLAYLFIPRPYAQSIKKARGSSVYQRSWIKLLKCEILAYYHMFWHACSLFSCSF
jgi:hypothetical protein